MDDKVFQHMTRTGTYLLIQELNATDLNSVQSHLSKIVEEFTLLLNDLRERQCCGFGQPLNHLLANIYMFYWQQDSVKILVNQNEIFGRYLNEIHINSQLRTIINHDNDIEPHGLSFISDHPPVMYSTLIQVCLMRAALIRSKVSDFHNERCDVQIVFLNSGYSINFIQEHVEQLFPDFHISNWKSNLNQNTYDKMREEII
ncbi:unnamed protein product, partial [Rotaria sp. Silwood1]